MKTATKQHVAQVQTWFNDEDEILNWAGPSFGFPNTEVAFQEQLSATGFTSFSLLHNGQLVGFGQYQLLPPFLHLGRLVVNPANRGIGLASILLAKLIDKGAQQGLIKTVSLFVYLNNTVAYKAYTSAGFTKAAPPLGKRAIEGCDFLILSRD